MSRRIIWSWRNQRRGADAHGPFGGPIRFRATLEADHRDFPARQPAAHRFQHVGDDGSGANDRGTLRVGPLSLRLYCDGRLRLSVEFHHRAFQRGSFWIAAWSGWPAARAYYRTTQHRHAHAAEPIALLARLHRGPRHTDAGHR